MSVEIRYRRGTAAAWAAANPVLAEGEPGWETDTGVRKTGDGATAWADLPVDLSDTYGPAALADPTADQRQALDAIRVAPTLTPLTERVEPLRNPLIQIGSQTVYAAFSRVGEVPDWTKTTDGGATWTVLSTMPGTPMAAIRLASGTILAVQEAGTTTVGGSMPEVWRSTDDGATWATVPAGLKFPPLSTQGIVEGTDGSVMIGEYGNVSPHQYRIMRSTDDGLTWTATLTTDGTEPQGDPGHIHSVTYDPIADKHVAFSDRPIVDGVSGPRIYASDDNGATWDLLGEAWTVDRPNFVAPMYFANYIAWGSDNQINGRISRIARSDFYAGNFDATETVAQLSQKAMYFTFPLRPDVWVVSMATEHINSSQQDDSPGSYANEIWVVSADGSLVTPGAESYNAETAPGVLSNLRAGMPSRALDAFDHDGIVWGRMPVGRPRPYACVPFSQGVEPAGLKRVQTRAIPYLPDRVPMVVHKSDGDTTNFLAGTSANGIILEDTTAPIGDRAAIRWDQDGTIAFLSGGAIVASVGAGSGNFNVSGSRGLRLTSTGVAIFCGGGSPEGSLEARPGSLFLSYSGGRGTTAWVKESGIGSTGWAPTGHPSGASTSRPSSPPTGLSFFDTTLGKPIWYSGAAWVDATGTAV